MYVCIGFASFHPKCSVTPKTHQIRCRHPTEEHTALPRLWGKGSLPLPRTRPHRSWVQGPSQEFATGTKEGVGGQKSPSGVQMQSPGGGLPQKLETHAEYSTEQSHRLSQIAYCSESDYTLKKFQATTGGMHPCPPPLGYATGWSYS